MQGINEIKTPIYEAPEGYFEEFEVRVCSYVHSMEKSKRHHTILRRLYMGVSTAAAMIAIYIGAHGYENTDIPSYSSIEITSAEELHAYVSDIQKDYSNESSIVETVEDMSPISDFYLSQIEEMGETQDQDTENLYEEVLNYNIMELASL